MKTDGPKITTILERQTMARLDNTTKAAQTVEQKHSKNNNPKPLHVPREKQTTTNDNHDE